MFFPPTRLGLAYTAPLQRAIHLVHDGCYDDDDDDKNHDDRLKVSLVDPGTFSYLWFVKSFLKLCKDDQVC